MLEAKSQSHMTCINLGLASIKQPKLRAICIVLDHIFKEN